jgi:hypothetical protein
MLRRCSAFARRAAMRWPSASLCAMAGISSALASARTVSAAEGMRGRLGAAGAFSRLARSFLGFGSFFGFVSFAGRLAS